MGITDFHQLQKFYSNTYIFFVVLSVVVGFLGILGNILCIIVLSRPEMRNKTINLLLLCLAFWDVAAIIGVLGSLFQELCYALGETAQHASNGFTILVTLERCIHVCMPLRSRHIITMKRTHIVIIVLNIFTVLCNLPFWFHYDFNYSVTEFSKSWFFQWFFSSPSELIIFHLLPFILIICGNITIVVAISKYNKVRRGMQAVSTIGAKEFSMTKITLTIIGIDLLTNLLLIVWIATGTDSLYSDTISGNANLIMMFTIVVNSSVNFLIYCGLGESFRKQFRATFFGCCTREEPKGDKHFFDMFVT